MTEFDYSAMEQDLLKLTIQLPKDNGKAAYITDFGAKAQQGYCCLEAFARAISWCREHQAARLIIPRGTYYFYACPQKAHLCLDNLQDFILDGQGSSLIFEQVKPYISIHNSRRLLVKDLFMDWNWEKAPLASVGILSGMASEGEWLEFTFPACEDIPEQLLFHIAGPFDPIRYTPGCMGGMEFRPWADDHIKKAGDGTTDEKMMGLVRELSGVFKTGMQKTGRSTMRFFPVLPSFALEHFHLGDCYNFRHFEYEIQAVSIADTTDCTLDGITLYSCPGSGFVGNGDMRGLHIKSCRITPRPGTARSVTSAADCLHICNSLGNLLIEDCEFGYAGDDCINIHDNSSMGIEILDHHTLLAKRVTRSALLFEAGYEVELRNPDLSATGYSSRLTDAVYRDKERTCVLTFADPLPDHLSPDTVLWNKRFQSQNYVIRRCRFTNNRARGVLLQSSFGILEQNIFENIQGAAIQIETGCESRWSEGHGVTGLIIRDNIIRHCDLNAWQMAVLYMGVYLPGGRTEAPIFQNILIEHNSFIDCPRLAMFLSSCRNVIARDNTVINSNQLPLGENCYGSSTMEAPIYGETYHDTIQFEKAQDCVDERNQIFTTIRS